ncbi:TIR protein [Candidatus Magnetomorum sp. HK-1]|nr:TIR protein [Candidatus Magnetomorum sp. HK-1]
MNPYNYTEPGRLFVGYERMIDSLIRGFINGHSFALLGGRRCGKTSFLIQMEKELRIQDLSPYNPIPCRLSMQQLGVITPDILFESIYKLVTTQLDSPLWQSVDNKRDYENFLNHLQSTETQLEKQYGEDWLVILLIDELDNAKQYLSDDFFFQNLRHLLMESDYKRHFRLIATGVKELARLISSGASPLNNLRNKYIGILSGKSARKMVSEGFPDDIDPDYLFKLTGRHPYLLHAILEKLWDDKNDWDKKGIKKAANTFLKERNDFSKWFETFEASEKAIYSCLANAAKPLSISEIKKTVEPSISTKVDEALTVLSYHAIIDDSDEDEIEIAGTFFKNWFLEKYLQNDQNTNSACLKKNIFICYSHNDKNFLEKYLIPYLKQLKYDRNIDFWYDKAIQTGHAWKPEIEKAIQSSGLAICLISQHFLSSDFIRQKELPMIFSMKEKGMIVIPILVDNCGWKRCQEIEAIQILPKCGTPLLEMNDKQIKETLDFIMDEIDKNID